MLDRVKRLAFPLTCIAIFIVLILVGLTNRSLIDDLRSQGKDYVAVTPTAAPKDGTDGRSAYQIWLDNGHTGSEMDFLTWLRGTSGRDGRDGRQGEKGERGVQGERGIAGLQGERGDPGYPGVQGAQGQTGATGASGANGRTPELACVIRWDPEIEGVTRYFAAWKYTDETTWRDMYRIPSGQASGMGCKDLRE